MLRFAILAALLTVISACSFGPDSRYRHKHDFAPDDPIAPHEVSDAVPRADPILKAGNKSPYTVNGVTYTVLPSHRYYRETGIASWYGAKFDGHATSNGEIFSHYKASAAHKSLPIPCYARVTNLENGLSVVVRVNDRGPFHPNRLIDLSYAAAVKLGYADKGTAKVEVAVIDVAGVEDLRGVSTDTYRYLQVGAFANLEAAIGLRDRLQQMLSAPVFVSPVDAKGARLYRVRVGPLVKVGAMAAVQQRLRDAGFGAGKPLP